MMLATHAVASSNVVWHGNDDALSFQRSALHRVVQLLLLSVAGFSRTLQKSIEIMMLATTCSQTHCVCKINCMGELEISGELEKH